ncbi:hypothetical protein [Mycolicibacterium sarraceniae]|uniref:hypothetical protein n=1 Tax=Mycolicibacterium sarraceniae TaxID=1534348 RepID=UPI001F266DDF|nr:hypothetical protein [Mycolicibacterium sarraceniae]
MGPANAEAFVSIAITTILLTRLYLRLTGYPQIGGGRPLRAHECLASAASIAADRMARGCGRCAFCEARR